MSGSYNGSYYNTQDVTVASATFGILSNVNVVGEPGIYSSIPGVQIDALGDVAASLPGGIGVKLTAGGELYVGKNAQVYGYTAAVEISGGAATLINVGTIHGHVDLYSTSSNTLALFGSSSIIGTVTAYHAAPNKLILGYGTGTVSGLGTSFVNFGSVLVYGGYWTLEGNNAVGYAQTLTDRGALTVAAGATLANSFGSIALGAALAVEGVLYNYLGNIGPDGSLSAHDIIISGVGTLINEGNIDSPVVVADHTAFVTNSSRIDFATIAVGMADGRLDNSGNITGGAIGVSLASAAGSILNTGTVLGNTGISAAGTLINGAYQLGATTASSALISGSVIGVIASRTFTNYGSVLGGKTAVAAIYGAVITNEKYAIIAGGTYGIAQHLAGATPTTMTNKGTIRGGSAKGMGVLLTGSAMINNHGSIAGYRYGIGAAFAPGTTATVANSGEITSTGTDASEFNAGVAVAYGGSISNYGTISGLIGVLAGHVPGGATVNVTNYGLIRGTATTTSPAVASIGALLGAGTLVNVGYPGTAILGGTIVGYDAGVKTYDSVTVINDGLLNATGTAGRRTGLYMRGGGTVLNGTYNAKALIQGAYGIVNFFKPVTISNQATIRGLTVDGMDLYPAGHVVNGSPTNTSALIVGKRHGIANAFAGAPKYQLTVTNYATIKGNGGDGIAVFYDTKVVNGSTADTIAAITGSNDGISTSGRPSTVQNFATIRGGKFVGVAFVQGGTLVNGTTDDTHAYVVGANYGVQVLIGPGFVQNEGTIRGSGYDGVEMFYYGAAPESGVVINGSAEYSTALIHGARNGVKIYRATGTVVNYGMIEGSNTGVVLYGGTVETSGTIYGAGGKAVALHGVGVESLLEIHPGAVFNGIAYGYSQPDDRLELATGSSVGTLTELGTKYTGFGRVLVDAAASWAFAGANYVGGSVQLIDAGTATLLGTGLLGNAGVLAVAPFGSFIVAANARLSNSYLISIAASSLLQLAFTASFSNTGIVHNDGVLRVGAGAVLANENTITQSVTSGAAVEIAYTGVVFNDTGHQITAQDIAIYGTAAYGTVQNFGTIAVSSTKSPPHYIAIDLVSGGTVTNEAPGTISGGNYGVVLGAGTASSVTNFGVVTGKLAGVKTAGGTVTNYGTITGTDPTAVMLHGGRLRVAPHAVFNGTVSASAPATLELMSAASAGTLTGLGSSFVNFGSVVFDAGASWLIAGDTTGLSGTISGFAFSDTLDLTGLHETVLDYVGTELTLTGDAAVTLDLPGTFATASFLTAPDGAGTGTDITVACFAAGTRIATRRGDLPVEHLHIGDHVNVQDETLPIIWIGHRHIDCRRHPDPARVWPLRIATGAFGPGLPRRTLYLSPDHAVFLFGVLIPIRHLINGTTIRQEPRNAIDYFHIELSRHSVLQAEGLPAESYLDTDNRAAFANGGNLVALHPDFAARRREAAACAPFIVCGPLLDAARNLTARATAFRSAAG